MGILFTFLAVTLCRRGTIKEVQVGNDQEKAQSERNSAKKEGGGGKLN